MCESRFSKGGASGSSPSPRSRFDPHPDRAPPVRPVLLLAFAASGVAGLIYELVWSRYLAMMVGHAAYAQVLVISVFLAGLALGSLAVGRRSERIRRPLRLYAAAEALLCVAGLAFHPVFVQLSEAAYTHLFPALGTPGLTSAAQWTLASLLILPQSILLGTTFPLMSAGLLRAMPDRTGHTVAWLYFVNSFGGAAGVLLGGFGLIAWAGLPGALGGAAFLNALAAGLALAVTRGRIPTPATDGPDRTRSPLSEASVGAGPALSSLWAVLLTVSFFTALASFIYEIAWIRMLSLAMGSATHSFELMLSAFILGLALGSLASARLVTRSRRPLRALGWIQWLMGLTALATLFAYQESFDVMGYLVRTLPQREDGYTLFTLARYGVAMAVMLPSTICAGMTLPLITSVLLDARAGERAVGWVYGVNTLGSMAGVALAGLVLLPALGLKGMLVAGATLDMLLGVGVLLFVARRGAAPRSRRATGQTGLAAGLTAVAVLSFVGLVHLDGRELIGGVYRYGTLPRPDAFEPLFYADGRTATVGVHRLTEHGLTVLSTNGKPDASLGDRWLESTRTDLPPEPIYFQDEATQLVAALVSLAHVPDARSAAMIGHGSGVTGHYLLAKPDLESLITIEIEPQMLAGSSVFFPANARVFEDPRSRIVIDDAKAWFSHRRDRYDLILSEPSNPWVSGTASLFTREFYRRVQDYMSPGGVFAQWIQLYELTDDAVSTVLAALHHTFADYRAFLVGDTDLLIVARAEGALPEPDWSVATYPPLVEDLSHIHPLAPVHLGATRVFGRAAVAPLLDTFEPLNSDYFPHLDLAAERGRFFNSFAEGLYGLAEDRFDLPSALEGRRTDFAAYAPVPVWGIPRMRALGLSSWLRLAAEDRTRTGGAPAFEYTDAEQRLDELVQLMELGNPPPRGWIRWTQRFRAVDAWLHGGTAGVADREFYRRVRAYLEAQNAPSEVWATVDFFEGVGLWDAAAVAAAAQILVRPVAEEEAAWVDAGTLLDGAVWAGVAMGDSAGARRDLARLLPASGRDGGDFRVRLLRAHIEALGQR